MTQLTFDRPAETWLEALPLGNGRLGAMCYGGTDVVRFDINDETAWSGSPASERAQPTPDALSAAALLDRARKLITAGRPADAEAALKAMQSDYSQSYLPFATVTVSTGSGNIGPTAGGAGQTADSASDYRRSLDLETATHLVRFRAGTETVTHSTFVSARHGVLVHVIEGVGPAGTAGLDITSPLRQLEVRTVEDRRFTTHTVLLRLPRDVPPTHASGFPSATWSVREGDSVEGAIVARATRERATDVGERIVVFVATETTFTGLGEPLRGNAQAASARATARIEAAVDVGADAILDDHRRDHAELFSRVSLRLHPPHLPSSSAASGADDPAPTTSQRLARAFADQEHPLANDPGLAAVLFDYGRYLLLSSSRPGGLPATLQGIWNDSMQPPWSSNYTLNINLQMNYWQANVVNLPESAEPLIDFIVRLAAAGAATARRLYAAPGWVAHHNSDAWLYTAQVGARAGNPEWAFWPMAGVWLVRHIWEGVAFGSIRGRELRERLWPVIRGAAEFGLHWTVRMPDGSWGTLPSTSPENTFVTESGLPSGVDRSTAMDLSLLRDLFQITVDAAQRAGVDNDSIVDRARRMLSELPAAPVIGSDGRVLEWSSRLPEVDEHHRHVSPLYFVYPGPGIYDEEHAKSAALTLEKRGDASTGWSLVWKLALWARLGNSRKVSDLLGLYFQPASADRGQWAGGLYPNLFAAHPPFQIDGNLGFVAAVAEALLQSHAGTIHLLPAVPRELGTGEVAGLIARPGVIVDIRWRQGVLESATLRARDEQTIGTYCVRYDDSTVSRWVPSEAPLTLVAADFAAD